MLSQPHFMLLFLHPLPLPCSSHTELASPRHALLFDLSVALHLLFSLPGKFFTILFQLPSNLLPILQNTGNKSLSLPSSLNLQIVTPLLVLLWVIIGSQRVISHFVCPSGPPYIRYISTSLSTGKRPYLLHLFPNPSLCLACNRLSVNYYHYDDNDDDD